MFSLLLAIIYLAFISLGLPDSLLGSAWPVMREAMGVSSSFAGIVTMLIAGGTIISSLSSDWLTKKIGTGVVVAISVTLTALGLLGFSFSTQFWMLCCWALPYGLGAGAIDAALNNYVALHYSARHMSWLHCCWGVGASISPYIMGLALENQWGWENGFRIVFYIQIVLAGLMFLSLPLWKKCQVQTKLKEVAEEKPQAEKELKEKTGIFQVLKIRGVLFLLTAFFCYCALESTSGLWAASYLVSIRQVDKTSAARFASFFYLGITIGRAIAGFFANKIKDKNMIRIGFGILTCGILLVLIPFSSSIPALVGLIVIGLGCAPIYPSIIHSTPFNFGPDKSQAIIGIEMASAYVGSTFMPPLFGLIGQVTSFAWYPLYLLSFNLAMFILLEVLNRIIAGREKNVIQDNRA